MTFLSSYNRVNVLLHFLSHSVWMMKDTVVISEKMWLFCHFVIEWMFFYTFCLIPYGWWSGMFFVPRRTTAGTFNTESAQRPSGRTAQASQRTGSLYARWPFCDGRIRRGKLLRDFFLPGIIHYIVMLCDEIFIYGIFCVFLGEKILCSGRDECQRHCCCAGSCEARLG